MVSLKCSANYDKFLLMSPIFEINIFSNSANMRTINKKRADLLAPMLAAPQNEQEQEERLMLDNLDCQFTVNALAFKLLMGTYSYKEEMQCECSFKDTRESPIMKAQNPLSVDFSNFIEAVVANLPDPVCPLCKRVLTIEREYGQYSFIEVVFLENDLFLMKSKHSKAIEGERQLKDVPDVISILEDQYSLCGVVKFQNPVSKKGIGHFTAIVKSLHSWTEFDDMKNTPKTTNPNGKIIIASVLYVKLEAKP